MKDIRKYIDENRELFDEKEPPAGHFDRFEALLAKPDDKEVKKRPVRRTRLISLISVAASIAILIGIGITFYAPDCITLPSGEEKGGKNETMMNEFQVTNDYYNQQMEEQIADIMCKLAYTDSENQAQLTADLQRIMDNNADFVNEMAKNENKEIAIKYLVKHYKTNIQVLENINEKLGKHTKC